MKKYYLKKAYQELETLNHLKVMYKLDKINRVVFTTLFEKHFKLFKKYKSKLNVDIRL